MATEAVNMYRKNMQDRRERAQNQTQEAIEIEIAPGIRRTKDGYVIKEDDFLIAASIAPQTVVARLNELRTMGEVARLQIEGGEYLGEILLSNNAFEELTGKRDNAGFGVSEADLGDYNGSPTRRGEAYMAAYEADKPFKAFQRARDTAKKLVKKVNFESAEDQVQRKIRTLLMDPTERGKAMEMWNEYALHTRKESAALTQLREKWYRDDITRAEYEFQRMRCVPTMDELAECWTHWSEYEKSLAKEMERRGVFGPMLIADGYAALMRSLGIEI